MDTADGGVAAPGGEVDRHMEEGLGTVDDSPSSVLSGDGADFGHWQPGPAGVADGADHHQLCAGRDGCPQPGKERSATVHGDLPHDDTWVAGGKLPRSETAAVFLVGGEDFVVGLKGQASSQHLHRFGGVGWDGHFLGSDAQVGGDALPGRFGQVSSGPHHLRAEVPLPPELPTQASNGPNYRNFR